MESIIENLHRSAEHWLSFEPSRNWEKLIIVSVGAALLLFGRRLYWCFLIATGFVIGSIISGEFLPPEPKWLSIAAPLLVGIAAALLIVFLQKLALRLTGMIAGGFLGFTAAEGFLAKPMPLIMLLLGSVIGFWLVMILFDWALIILSSLSGTALIAGCLPIENGLMWVLAAGLIIVGVAIQWKMQHGKLTPKSRSSQSSRS